MTEARAVEKAHARAVKLRNFLAHARPGKDAEAAKIRRHAIASYAAEVVETYIASLQHENGKHDAPQSS